MQISRITTGGAVPAARSGSSAQEYNGKIYIFGGFTEDKKYTDELFSYNISRK